jgi:tellurite resistance protein TehA-like permease
VQSSFVSLGSISTMLVANAVLQLSRPLAVALFAAALAGQLALGAWLLGRAWQGGQCDSVTPALYLPAVGQNFVAASVAVALGWPQIAAWALRLRSTVVVRHRVHRARTRCDAGAVARRIARRDGNPAGAASGG